MICPPIPPPPPPRALPGKISCMYLNPCSSPITEAEHVKRRRSQLSDKISTKLHAFFWVLAGVMVAYQTDFVRVLMESDRVNRRVFVSLFSYCNDQYHENKPRVHPGYIQGRCIFYCWIGSPGDQGIFFFFSDTTGVALTHLLPCILGVVVLVILVLQ